MGLLGLTHLRTTIQNSCKVTIAKKPNIVKLIFSEEFKSNKHLGFNHCTNIRCSCRCHINCTCVKIILLQLLRRFSKLYSNKRQSLTNSANCLLFQKLLSDKVLSKPVLINNCFYDFAATGRWSDISQPCGTCLQYWEVELFSSWFGMTEQFLLWEKR